MKQYIKPPLPLVPRLPFCSISHYTPLYNLQILSHCSARVLGSVYLENISLIVGLSSLKTFKASSIFLYGLGASEWTIGKVKLKVIEVRFKTG